MRTRYMCIFNGSGIERERERERTITERVMERHSKDGRGLARAKQMGIYTDRDGDEE